MFSCDAYKVAKGGNFFHLLRNFPQQMEDLPCGCVVPQVPKSVKSKK